MRQHAMTNMAALLAFDRLRQASMSSLEPTRSRRAGAARSRPLRIQRPSFETLDVPLLLSAGLSDLGPLAGGDVTSVNASLDVVETKYGSTGDYVVSELY
jgi:hypothetical protein